MRRLSPEVVAALEQADAADAPMPDCPDCPDWCTMRPGHCWDSEYDGQRSRGHSGPEFGPWGSTEYDDGMVVPGVYLTVLITDVSVSGLSAEEADRLSRQLPAAAECVRAQT